MGFSSLFAKITSAYRGGSSYGDPSKAALIAILSKVVTLALSYLTIPLALRFLGNERYGLWMVGNSTVAFTSFLDLGITPTIKNRMAEAFAKNDDSRFNSYASTALSIAGSLFALGIALAGGARLLDWASFFHVTDPQAQSESANLVSALVITVMISLALSMVEAIFYARLEIVRPKIYSLCSALLSFAVLLLCVNLEVSLPLLVLLTGLASTAGRFVLLAELTFKRKIFPRIAGFGRMLPEIVQTSTVFSGIQLAAVVISFLPTFLLARFHSLSDVTTFTTTYKLVTIPMLAIAELLPIYWPMFTIAWAKGEVTLLRARLSRLVMLTIIGTMGFGILCSVFGRLFIFAWTSGMVQVPAPLLILLGIWLVAQSTVYWLSTLLHSISDFKFEFLCYSFSAVLLLAIALVLNGIGPTSGIAWAMVGSTVVGCLAPMAVRVSKKLSLPLAIH